MEVSVRSLIASELDAMHELAKLLLSHKSVKTLGFTDVQSDNGEKFSIHDMVYNDNTYFMVLYEEGQEESGVFIRSALIEDLEIMLPLPAYIRMTNKEEAMYDDLC